MRARILAILWIGAVAVFAWPASASRAAQPGQNDFAAEGVRAVIERYFEGHATGDASHMRRAFLPTAHVEGIRAGKFTSWTLDEYCALFDGKPAPDESTRIRTIDRIDVSGNAAAAKATLVHGDTVFTDYFVLLQTDEGWRIANKVYYGRPAADAASAARPDIAAEPGQSTR